MSATSKVTRKSSAASKRGQKNRKKSRSRSPSVSANDDIGESSLVLPKSRFGCSQDVVDFFVDQMLDSIVDTYTPLECWDYCSCPIDDESQESLKMKDFKDINSEDLKSADVVSVRGSTVVLKKKKKRLSSNTSSSLAQKVSGSIKNQKSTLMNSSKGLKPKEGSSLFRSSIQSSSKWSGSFGLLLSFPDEEEFPIHIVFNNGNVYEGFVRNKLMHGIGKYLWVDGTVYEGEFKDGFPTGKGIMTLPELSHYEGDFCHGLFHGQGVLNIVSTPILYSGGWDHGKKSGKGWLLYEAGSYYEGDWAKDLMEGSGLRQYSSGAKHKGQFSKSARHGFGLTQWTNGDFYRGEWLDGVYSGHGEYFWGTFRNDSFTFYPQNVYKGSWLEGKRHGEGTLYFGSSNGSHYNGYFEKNFKHGAGCLVCGNGKVIEKSELFLCDKLLCPPTRGSRISYNPSMNVPIFAIPESIDIGFYIDKFFSKIGDIENDKLLVLKNYEQVTLRNTLILYMPQLRDLYEKYSNFAKVLTTTTGEEFVRDLDPVMVRLFLWQFYRDVEIWKYNSTSLVDTDIILSENPTSCVREIHNPFEHIYFWQFILSLAGVIISTISLEDQVDFIHGGVCSYVVRRFLDGLEENFIIKSLPSFKFKDFVPIKSVYALYQDLGEPLTAKEFLKKTCLKKRDHPPCRMELQKPPVDELKFIGGVNTVPLFHEIRFISNVPRNDGDAPKNWSNLYDFRHLKTRNIINCLAEVCPLIKQEGFVVNLDYPLTFLEFYDVLLNCIFKLIELELKHEKKLLLKVTKEPEVKEKTKPGKKSGSEKGSAKTAKSIKKRKR